MKIKNWTILLLLSLKIFAQPTPNTLVPKVDKRMEALSIAFRLAKPNEFSDTLNPQYAKAIHQFFDKYSNHTFINYLKTLPDEYVHWEKPSLAVHISQPPAFEPLVMLNDTTKIDGWDNRTLLNVQFLRQLRQFYQETEAEKFFASQAEYYESVNQQFEKEGIKVHTQWVKDFFGIAPTEQYFALVGLQGIGNWNYLRVNYGQNRRDAFTLFSPSKFDQNSLPIALNTEAMARSNLHEYIHAFTNQLVDKNMTILRKPSEKLLAKATVWEKVKNTFFNNYQFLMYESLVRASTIKYLVAHSEIRTTLEKEIATQEKAGFLWIRDLVKELDRYEQNRNKYPDINAFMPELNHFFTKLEF
jgi:Domain of unknown function (DUF4932)